MLNSGKVSSPGRSTVTNLSVLREHPGTGNVRAFGVPGTTESIQSRSVGRDWRTTQGYGYDVCVAPYCAEPQDRARRDLLDAAGTNHRVPMIVHGDSSRDVSIA